MRLARISYAWVSTFHKPKKMRVEPPLSIRNRKGCPAEGSILYTPHSLQLTSHPWTDERFSKAPLPARPRSLSPKIH
jgi:hypothetical protein